MRSRRRTLVATPLAALAVLLAAAPARADDERPRIMLEPGEVVDVADAFDGDDPYDFWFTLGFEYEAKEARLMRETAIFEPGLTTGGFTSRQLLVGKYKEQTSRLTPRLDFGIYHDFSFYARLPVILNNARRIVDTNNSATRADTALAGARGEQLFTLPFEAPARSGIEFVALGLDLDIFNQQRDTTKPTWLLGFETRLNAGKAMRPCTKSPKAGQVECADAMDINRNGLFDGGHEGIEADSSHTPGVSRGTVGLEIHTLMSKRIKYVEPYGGFNALFEFQMGDNLYGATDLEGAIVNHPPIMGGVTLGMMIHPWEDRENFGRLTFNVRFDGQYRSEGRDYSELFDALGSSDAGSLRKPTWARFTGCTNVNSLATCDGAETASVIDTNSEKTYFTGLSVVEAHGRYKVSGSVSWRAAELFRLNLGLGYQFDQAHGISHDQPCNPDLNGKGVGEAGPCHSGTAQYDASGNLFGVSASGLPNPAYRPSVNAVGRRFYVDQVNTFSIFTSAAVMF
ncbi:MAG: hypothetical protein IT373_26425 [Polyangiaceae bacterium]|nr:hypothetical protein [Polyangiaceae bacterium]